MRRSRHPLVALLVPFLIAVGCSHSQTAPAPARPDSVAPAPLGKPLMWEVKGKSGPVYLYGTIHTGGREAVHPLALKTLDTARKFVMEADITKVDQRQVLKMGMLPKGESLDQKIDPAHFKKLVAILGGRIPEFALKHLQPWLVGMALEASVFPKNAKATDLVLLDEAKKKHLELGYFETWQQQLNILRSIFTKDDLVQSIDQYPQLKDDMAKLLAAYRAGDAAKLQKLLLDPRVLPKNQYNALIKKRNEAWVPQIEGFLANGGNVFVAVGAGHLIGPDGVPTLLAKKGYQVHRVE